MIRIPDKEILKALEERRKAEEAAAAEAPVKRGRGRPKGSKNKPGTAKAAMTRIDPKTGIPMTAAAGQKALMGRMGDEKVTAFVQYHIDMLQMRQGVNKKDVNELYRRFYTYLAYCAEHGIIPGNMNCYFAMGVSRSEIHDWKVGTAGDAAHMQFALDVTSFFQSIHEQGSADGILNPISSIFWQKAHDGMIEAQKLEVVQKDALGERQSAEQIASKYSDVELPD